LPTRHLAAAGVLNWQEKAAGGLLHAHNGLARRGRGGELPADAPLAIIELGPQPILDGIGVLEREIAVCLGERRHPAAVGPGVEQPLEGILN